MNGKVCIAMCTRPDQELARARGRARGRLWLELRISVALVLSSASCSSSPSLWCGVVWFGLTLSIYVSFTLKNMNGSPVLIKQAYANWKRLS